MASQVETGAVETVTTEPLMVMTKGARYYQLHRDQKLAKEKERYDSRPEVIAKREERERKRAEREQQKQAILAAKQAEKQAKIQLKHELALKTSKKCADLSGAQKPE